MRKAIQIFVTEPELGEWSATALCDDGTMWTLDEPWKEWDKLPTIPQEDENLS